MNSMMSFGSIVKISSQGRSSNKLDSNIRQISITAVPAPSLRHAGEPGKPEKSGTLPLAAEIALAAKCGDDKDAIASICGDFHGFSRSGQHSHSSWRGSGDGRHSVEPARLALRRAVVAGVSLDR